MIAGLLRLVLGLLILALRHYWLCETLLLPEFLAVIETSASFMLPRPVFVSSGDRPFTLLKTLSHFWRVRDPND